MAVPKKRTSKSRRNKRRAHDALKRITIAFDNVTGDPKLPHHMLLRTGMYNGRQVLLLRKKLQKQGDQAGQNIS